MKPMPACERASLSSASGRHSRSAFAKSPPLKADSPARKSSSGEPATTPEPTSADQAATIARPRATAFTNRFPMRRSRRQPNAWTPVRPPLCRRSDPSRNRDRGTVEACEDRPGPRKGRQQRCCAGLAGDADRGRKPVCSGRPRPDHRRVDKAIRASAGVRIENVMETPARFEGRAVTARHRKRHVGKLNRARNAACRPAAADADPPGMTIRVAADGMKLAEIDDGTLEAFMAQQVRDRVGDKSLREAVEGDAHAGAFKCDMRVADIDSPKVNAIARDVAGARLDVRLDVGVRPEMCFVEPPQWLHRDIEGAVAQYAEATAFLHKRAQLGRRLIEPACRIKTRDFAVRP